MKKIIIIFILFLSAQLYSQKSYFISDTTGVAPKRITNYESANFLTGKQYLTIAGVSSGTILFSMGDSLFAAKTTMSWAANANILMYSIWLPQYRQIWYKSSSGSININLQFRVQ